MYMYCAISNNIHVLVCIHVYVHRFEKSLLRYADTIHVSAPEGDRFPEVWAFLSKERKIQRPTRGSQTSSH